MSVRAAIILMMVGFVCPPQANSQEDAINKQLAPGKQVEMAFSTSDGATVQYLLYLPADYDQTEQFPLMLFLHGRGESNGPLSLVAKWGPPAMVARGDEMPYIIVSPQCPQADNWSSDTQRKRLMELLESSVNALKVDNDRVYLTGLSMGGFGSWRLAAEHPDRFAAVVPICGGVSESHAEQLKEIPIWAFHGDRDAVVPIQRTSDIVDAIKQLGGTAVQFTTLEGVGHNSWSSAYATPDLYQWMNQQRRQP